MKSKIIITFLITIASLLTISQAQSKETSFKENLNREANITITEYNKQEKLYAQENNPNQEIDIYTRLISKHPHYADAYYNRGVGYQRFKQYDKAIKDYTQALKINPHYADAYHNRGVAYGELKQYDKAKSDLKKAAELCTQ